MIFRQLFDQESSTYTYLVACEETREAVLIDPVQENTQEYVDLVQSLSLNLLYAMDTHIHADHITALGELREQTGCQTIMSKDAAAACVSQKLGEGQVIKVGTLEIQVRHTPGHTSESCSFVMSDRVFTGDALLIQGTGRTDFQAGNAGDSWDSIMDKILSLPDDTLIYPGHDYRGRTVSTVKEEKALNPRIANRTRSEYIEIMDALDLPNPKMMDIAVPANQNCGELQ